LAIDNQITALLAAARRRTAVPDELVQQRMSFALGNGNIEEDTFSRATVTMMVSPESVTGGSAVPTDPPAGGSAARSALEALLRQYDLAVELIMRHIGPGSPRFILTCDIILGLQAALAYTGGPQPGYRSFSVRIATNDFEPIEPSAVPGAIEELCAHVNQRWDATDALELAAYVLWRLNWIHPFSDGNGRTARALSYIVLSVRLGVLLPGSPTIPEQLLQQRGDYYDALAKADEAYRERGIVDVGSLRTLLGAMLLRQLEAMPALSPEDLAAVHDVVERRVRAAPTDLVSEVFGEGIIEDRLWSLGDHLVLQLGPRTAIEQAERIHAVSDSPFPRLLAPRGQGKGLLVAVGQRGLVLRDCVLDATDGYALVLERNATVTIERPRVRWNGAVGSAGSWDLEGALYVVRPGRELPLGRAPETFDILLVRHMAGLRR
jgi:Fic family protein